VKNYRMGPMFLPAVVSKVGGPLASLTIGTLGGGTNWPGASYDPETHTVFAQAANAGVSPLASSSRRKDSPTSATCRGSPVRSSAR